jgi:MoxR-like ATPase
LADTHDITTRLIKASLDSGIPGIVTGPPGTGKTGYVKDLEGSLIAGRPVKVLQLLASVREPTDIGGYPVPDLENWVVRNMPVDWAVEAGRLADEGYLVVIFPDELRCVTAAVQAALMKGIHENKVGDYQMPTSVRWIAAANSVEQSAGGVPLEAPMANRFMHIPWMPNREAWRNSMISNSFALQSDLSDEAKARLGQERAEIAAFIYHRPELLLQVPESEEEKDGPWPSPRTNDYTAHLWAAVGPGADYAFRQELMASCIGHAGAAEYVSWRSAMDLPDPEDTLAGKVDQIVFEDRPDITYAILSAAMAAVAGDWSNERYILGWKVLDKAAKDGAGDVATAMVRSLEDTAQGHKDVPSPVEYVKPFIDLMIRAGISFGGQA